MQAQCLSFSCELCGHNLQDIKWAGKNRAPLEATMGERWPSLRSGFYCFGLLVCASLQCAAFLQRAIKL